MVFSLHMLNLAKDGESDAIAYLYQHFLHAVFGYMVSRVSNQDTAEDLTSEVFLKMVENIHQVEAIDEATFAAWLFRIANTTIADYYRSQVKIRSVPLDEVGDIEYLCTLDDDFLETQKYLAEIFNLLTEEQRAVLTGSVMMGYDAETIGDIIGKSANAVRLLYFRGKKRLKGILINKEDQHAINP